MVDDERFPAGRHGRGRLQFWDARHAVFSIGAGALIFLLMTLADAFVGEMPIVAKAAVAVATALVVYFRFD